MFLFLFIYLDDQNPLLVEQELQNTVTQIKGQNQKGKSGKNRNKHKVKANNVKKSMLNIEYAGQSDNFNGVDIGSTKKISGTQPGNEETVWSPNSKLLKSLIDNKLEIDAGDVGVESDGSVNDGLLRPKIFSSYYNTPDSFRFGVEEVN